MSPSIFRARRGRRSSTPSSGRSALQTVLVHSVSRVGEAAVLLDLRSADPHAILADSTPGSHIDLHLADRLVRQYSLVDVGSETGRYLVCVQRDLASRGGSIMVHEQIRPGDHFNVSLPRNTFALRESASSVLLLAGGVGITPLTSMAARLHQTGTPFQLHAHARNAGHLPLHSHLMDSPYRDRVTTHFSDEGDSFRTTSPSALTTVDPNGAVYVCGPDAFVALARRRAEQAGWRPEQFVTERFTAGQTTEPGVGETSFSVVAASTGQSMHVGSNESIADVLERNGFDTYRSCGQGYCGSCVTGVLSGVPDHRDGSQTDAEHSLNTQINVCCSRSHTPVLQLDI